MTAPTPPHTNGAEPTGSTLLNGAPTPSDRHSLTLGPDGPILLHDHHLVNTLAAFNRENIPDRKPHAKGAGAFGELKITGDITKYTKAAVFKPGTSTRVLARFSTVAGEAGSPDTWRDVRGFALKFYTTEGNWDLVGNNTPIFFLRDPMKFPHFIRSQKRLPDSGLRDQNMQWDFWTMNPESAHQVTYLMGDRGLPRSWRFMNGYGSHTYMLVNASGERFWVKFHFHSDQGVENWKGADAEKIAGEDADFHRRDLFEAIEAGDFPSWTLKVQIMPYEEAKTYRYNPFDLTKIWSHADYPLIEVGTMTLNENVANFFAQMDQAGFAPSNIVPGIGFSPDRMLLARVFAYADAHRARLGVNHDQLPVNQPLPEVMAKYNAYTFDGAMRYHHSGDQATYAANSDGRPYADNDARDETGWEADGEMIRCAQTLRADDDDFGQAGILVREVFDDAGRDRLVETVAGALLQDVSPPVLERAFWYWSQVDQTIGARIRAEVEKGQADGGPGNDPDKAKGKQPQAIRESDTQAKS